MKVKNYKVLLSTFKFIIVMELISSAYKLGEDVFITFIILSLFPLVLYMFTSFEI